MRESPTVISLFADPEVWNVFPKDKILQSKDAFLKCDSYDVYLPILDGAEKELNVFEETILRLAELNRIDMEKACQQLCLPSDFVHVILEHLRYKEYIDEDGRISERGRNYFGKGEENVKPRDNLQIRPCRVLVLKQTGEIMSQFFPAVDKIGIRAELEKRKMTISYGSLGKPERVQGPIWTPKKGERRLRNRIRQEEILRMVQEYNRQNPLNKVRLSTSDAIEIGMFEEVYLHVKMILQRGMINAVIVSDGRSFVNGVATQYAQKEQQEAIQALRKSAERNIHIGKKAAVTFGKYSEVHSAMEQLVPVPEGESVDAIMQRAQIRSNNLISMHSALEWACAYVLRKWKISPRFLRSFQAGTSKQNQKILLRIATELGFSVEKDEESLLAGLDDLSMRQYQNCDPNLRAVLPLMIVSAKENSSCSLRKVAREMPHIFHMFKRLSDTKTLRHGNEKQEDDFNDYESIAIELRKFLKLALPDYATEDTRNLAVEQDDSSDIRLHAEENVDRLLGRAVYERFGDYMQSDIRELALTADAQNEMEPVRFVDCLYKVEESYLRSHTEAIRVFERNQKKELLQYLISVAREKQSDYEMPIELSTVGDNFIEMVVRHKNGTLGAYTLVFFGNLAESRLNGLDLPFILQMIAETLRYRKHGNNVCLQLTKEKMDAMRDEVFAVLKELEKY